MFPDFIFYSQGFSTFVPCNLRFLSKCIIYVKNTCLKSNFAVYLGDKVKILRFISLPYLKQLCEEFD